MRKKALSSNCITFMLFCQIALCFLSVAVLSAQSVSALSGRQITAITRNCSTIKQTLQTVRVTDARARTYLGSYYEKIYSNFIVPLNLRLTRNNQPSSELAATQVSFLNQRTDFIEDYITYQRSLEELINFDCVAHPSDFYGQLKVVRDKRNTMVTNVANLRTTIARYVEQVKGLKNGQE